MKGRTTVLYRPGQEPKEDDVGSGRHDDKTAVPSGPPASVPEANDAPASPPDGSVVAVGSAEKDKSKWEQAENWLGTSNRVGVFEKIVEQYKHFPDDLASDHDREEFNKTLGSLQEEFSNIPFNGSYQTTDAKKIIDLFRSDIDGKYSGQLYDELDEEIADISNQYRSRPN